LCYQGLQVENEKSVVEEGKREWFLGFGSTEFLGKKKLLASADGEKGKETDQQQQEGTDLSWKEKNLRPLAKPLLLCRSVQGRHPP